MAVANSSEKARWRRSGWVVLRGVLPPDLLAEVTAAVEEVAGWAGSGGGPGLHHFEQTDHGPALARSEMFADDQAMLGAFMSEGLVPELVGDLVGEPVVLFKEKVNFKLPGGAGFAPHQDSAAYRFATGHVSVMVPLDPSTAANGCLDFADDPGTGLLSTDDGGRISADVVEQLQWEPAEVVPGDLVVFGGFTPHRSGTNTSDTPRRALYLTYNLASEGELRERYYADKLAEFAAAAGAPTGERVRVSITDDFLGRPVERSEG